MPGSITDLATDRAPPELRAQVCVIGSGSGGGTAARVLAEAGLDVLLLEEGGDFLGDKLTRRDALYTDLYQDGGTRSTADLSITVLQGRVLGGGTIVNASDVVPIHEATARHWQRRFGLGDFSPERLAPYQRLASDDLRDNPIDPRLASRGNLVLEAGSKQLGLRGEHMHHNRVGCIGLGKCMVGCSVNAKQNVRLVSVPKALAAGCRVLTHARAVRIEQPTAEEKRVRVRAVDPYSYAERGELTVRARTVIVACNAINSAQLLLRSGIGNEHVGRHLTLQPQLFVFAEFPEPLQSFRGIPQSYAITQFEEHRDDRGLWGFRVEGLFATPGALSTSLGRAGAFGAELMQRYDRLACALCLIPDLPSGRVTVSRKGAARIEYTPRPDVHDRMRKAAKIAARSYLRAGATRVIVPLCETVELRSEAALRACDELVFKPAGAAIVSAHQQGTVRFSGSQRDGAARPNGEVYGARGIYVFDSSGYPSTASSHIMHPVISTARLLASELAT